MQQVNVGSNQTLVYYMAYALSHSSDSQAFLRFLTAANYISENKGLTHSVCYEKKLVFQLNKMCSYTSH